MNELEKNKTKEIKRTAYDFEKFNDFFIVRRKDKEVKVIVEDGIVNILNPSIKSSNHSPHNGGELCIVDKRNIVYSILRILIEDTRIVNGQNYGISKWAYTQAAKNIARRVYKHLNELMNSEDELYLSIQKKIYSLSGMISVKNAKKIKYLHDQGFLYLLIDASKYRAAANFIVNIGENGDRIVDILELSRKRYGDLFKGLEMLLFI